MVVVSRPSIRAQVISEALRTEQKEAPQNIEVVSSPAFSPVSKPSPRLLTSDELQNISSEDREQVILLLEAQIVRAGQIKDQTADRRGKQRYDKIISQSRTAINELRKGSGVITSREAVITAKSRFPEKKYNELKSKYATGEQRQRAEAGQREVEAVQASGLSAREYASLSVNERTVIQQQYSSGGRSAARSTAQEIQRQRFEAGREASEGVFITESGKQVIITSGQKPQTAGELIRRLEGKPFTPGRLSRPEGFAPLVREPQRAQPVPVAVQRPRGVIREDKERAARREASVFDLSFTELSLNLRQRQEELRVEGIRNPSLLTEARGAVTGFVGTFAEVGAYGEALIKRPGETIKTTASELGKLATGKKQFNVGQTLRQQPGYSIGRIAGELTVLKGTGEAVRAADTATLGLREAGKNLLSPRSLPVTVTESAPLGEIAVPTSAGVRNVRIAGAIGSRTLPGESVASQAARAGTTSPVAVSGARDFFNFLEFRKTVGKGKEPVPGQPLEKSAFFDPEGRLRPSRLGLDEPGRAGIVDVLSGEASFFREKPQALVYADAPIEALPKNLFDIEKSLRSGRPLSPAQEKRLLEFQLTPSGEFKPVGFLSREPEITLAPGERLVSEGTRGFALINGRNVKFLEVKLQPRGVQRVPRERVLAYADDAGRVTLTRQGRSSIVRQRPRAQLSSPVPRASSTRPGASLISSPASSPISSSGRASGISSPPGASVSLTGAISRAGGTSTGRGATSTRGGSTSRGGGTSITGASGRAGTPLIRAPPTAKPPIPRFEQKRERSRGFNVFANIGGQFTKINTGPLTRSEAITRGTKLVSGTSLATFRIREAGGFVSRRDTGLSAPVRRQFEQFRAPKRRSLLRGDQTFIERRQFRINTPGELKEITRKGIRASRMGVRL